MVRLDERPVQVRVHTQGRIEEVLPRPLLSDVQARHITSRTPGNHPLHLGMVNDIGVAKGGNPRAVAF
jgi:uncharacterized protein YcsI (UPF0317 family)